MRTRAGKSAAAAAAAALLAGSLLAAPSVEITNVQQQYPWTNTVDITYTVQGVNKTHQTNRLDHIVNDTYFATFEAKNGNTPIADVNGNTVFTNGLVQGNGTFTAQWQPKTDLQLTGCTMTPSVFRGEENAYLVINLETNKEGKCDWWYEPMSTQEESNKRYNTDLYKTKYMVLRRVPKGEYYIGYGTSGNIKQHKVNAAKEFYAGIFPITQAQYKRVIGNDYTSEDKTPVVYVSWNAMRGSTSVGVSIQMDPSNNSSFLIKLSTLAGIIIDMPTEEMWEIAARAGSTSRWHWGDTFDGRYCVYGRNAIDKVGTKLPNAWGLYDIAGNTWDWCLDIYNDYDLSTKQTDIYTPNIVGNNGNRVLRGNGGFYSGASSFSVSNRDVNTAVVQHRADGFRAFVVVD